MHHRRFEVTTLGTGAALPARGRYPTAQLVNVNEGLYLVDCGEGTQERLRELGVNFVRIQRILISHLHGDHYLGLMGLISSMHLMGRKEPLHVHGPPMLKEIIDLQLRASSTYLRFPLHFTPTVPESGLEVFADPRVRVTALELKHRIPCTGFVFTESQALRTLRKDSVHLIPHFKRQAVKQGEDLQFPDGTHYTNAELTEDPPSQRRYAYCSDTAFEPALVPFIDGVELLYHEATFTEMMRARAKETMHSTAAQAAQLALAANVGKLLLGHFSSRYKSSNELLQEALPIFPRTMLSNEGMTIAVDPRSIV